MIHPGRRIDITVRIPYRPSPGQEDFHRARGRMQERAAFCGTGGGKTVMGAFEVLSCCLEEPGSTWLCGEPTVPMLEKAMYPAWAIMLGQPLGMHPLTKEWNATKKRLRLPNASTVWFVSFEDPLSIEGPPEVDGVWADEGRVIRRFGGADGVWNQLTRRLRGRSDRPRRAILTTHSPTQEIVDVFKPAREERVETGHRIDLGGGAVHEAGYTRGACVDSLRGFWSWSPLDSAAWGTLNHRDALRIASQYHGADYTRIVLGRFARPSHVVYPAFDYARHVRPAPPRAAADGVTYGVDLGWTHKAVVNCHWWLGSSVQTVAEVAIDRAGVNGIRDAVLRLVPVCGDGPVYFGPDVRAPETVQELRRLGVDARETSGRVEDGVFVLNSRLQAGTWLLTPRHADAGPEEVWGCPLAIRQMDLYQRDPVTGSVQDRDNDALDACRAGIVGNEPQRAQVLRPTRR